MKVSERIKEIRIVVGGADIYPNEDKDTVLQGLIQLEVEIVEALQVARQEGWDAGYRWQRIEQLETEALQVARQEGYLSGYCKGYTGRVMEQNGD